jgi:tRNA-specific 2-thiouridylase
LYPGKASWNNTLLDRSAKKLGIASSAPLHVNKVDAPDKRVAVGSRKELFSKGLIARDINLIALERLERPYRVKAKIRYRHREAEAVLTAYNEKGTRVIFDEPQL